MANRERIQKRRQRESRNRNLIVGGVILALILIIGLIAWREINPGGGTSVEVLRADHLEDGAAVASPTDPPTFGAHYSAPLEAGFYTVGSPEFQAGDYEGYIIHSHEHGYVTFWYNCDLLDEQGCDQLMNDIQKVMDEFNGFKLIAFPRSSLDFPVVMTAWTQYQEFETFDAREAEKFIRVNRPLAPEPSAP